MIARDQQRQSLVEVEPNVAGREVVPAETRTERLRLDDAVAVPVVDAGGLPIRRSEGEIRDSLRAIDLDPQAASLRPDSHRQIEPLACELKRLGHAQAVAVVGPVRIAFHCDCRQARSHQVSEYREPQAVEDDAGVLFADGDGRVENAGLARQDGDVMAVLERKQRALAFARSYERSGRVASVLLFGLGRRLGQLACDEHRLSPEGGIARRVAFRAGVALQSQEHGLPAIGREVCRAVEPALAVRVSLEELLPVHPDAEGHAVAGGFGRGVVADGVGEGQRQRRRVGQLHPILGEDCAARGFPRRMHGDRLLRRASRDRFDGQIRRGLRRRALPADRQVGEGLIEELPGHAVGPQGPQGQGAPRGEDIDRQLRWPGTGDDRLFEI